MTRGTTRASVNGFTLVELLVSLAVLGLFGAMLLAALDKTASFLVRARDRTEGQDGVGAAQMLVRARIEALRAVTRDVSATPQVDANGDSTSFTFFAPPPDHAAPDALWRYRLTATAAGDLILFTASSLDDRYDFASLESAGWQPIPLLHRVKALNISYFGGAERSTERRWQTRWLAREQPPELVRVRVQFDDGDVRHWPDLVVRPSATVNTACRIDPVSATCRASGS
jgi:general secretion pathway protein J